MIPDEIRNIIMSCERFQLRIFRRFVRFASASPFRRRGVAFFRRHVRLVRPSGPRVRLMHAYPRRTWVIVLLSREVVCQIELFAFDGQVLKALCVVNPVRHGISERKSIGFGGLYCIIAVGHTCRRLILRLLRIRICALNFISSLCSS
jgi:hypothetical protein